MNEEKPATSPDVLECLDRLVEKGEMVLYKPTMRHFSQVTELIRLEYAHVREWVGNLIIVVPTEKGKEIAAWRKQTKGK